MAEPDDFKLIREIVAAGGSKYTSGNVDRGRYQRHDTLPIVRPCSSYSFLAVTVAGPVLLCSGLVALLIA